MDARGILHRTWDPLEIPRFEHIGNRSQTRLLPRDRQPQGAILDVFHRDGATWKHRYFFSGTEVFLSEGNR